MTRILLASPPFKSHTDISSRYGVGKGGRQLAGNVTGFIAVLTNGPAPNSFPRTTPVSPPSRNEEAR